MNSSQFTPMESEVLAHFQRRYSAQQFPLIKEISFNSRESTGAGRRTKISCERTLDFADGYLYLQGCFIEIDSVEGGLSVMVMVIAGRLVMLEFVVNGEENWDGAEESWKLVC